MATRAHRGGDPVGTGEPAVVVLKKKGELRGSDVEVMREESSVHLSASGTKPAKEGSCCTWGNACKITLFVVILLAAIAGVAGGLGWQKMLTAGWQGVEFTQAQFFNVFVIGGSIAVVLTILGVGKCCLTASRSSGAEGVKTDPVDVDDEVEATGATKKKSTLHANDVDDSAESESAEEDTKAKKRDKAGRKAVDIDGSDSADDVFNSEDVDSDEDSEVMTVSKKDRLKATKVVEMVDTEALDEPVSVKRTKAKIADVEHGGKIKKKLVPGEHDGGTRRKRITATATTTGTAAGAELVRKKKRKTGTDE